MPLSAAMAPVAARVASSMGADAVGMAFSFRGGRTGGGSSGPFAAATSSSRMRPAVGVRSAGWRARARSNAGANAAVSGGSSAATSGDGPSTISRMRPAVVVLR